MSPRMIIVGDHTPEPPATLPSPQRQRELWALERAQFSVAEQRDLAIRFVAATTLAAYAIESKNYGMLKTASREIATIIDQTAFLNAGLQTIIESTTDRSTKR